jgi:sortase A
MPRVSRRRKRISTFLLLVGLAGIGIWAWSIVRGDLFQRRASREFDELTHRTLPSPVPPPASPASPAPPAPPVAPRAPQPGEVIGRLVIPRLHLSAMVREGADSHTLGVALGHIPGTAMPGASGNAGIAGHRDTLFRSLRNIVKDDEIVFQTTQGDYTYRVEDTSIVKPSNTAVLDPGPHAEITLVTCYPFYYVGAAPGRFIVHARLLPAPVAGAGGTAVPRLVSPASRKLLARRGKPPARHPAYASRGPGF